MQFDVWYCAGYWTCKALTCTNSLEFMYSGTYHMETTDETSFEMMTLFGYLTDGTAKPCNIKYFTRLLNSYWA